MVGEKNSTAIAFSDFVKRKLKWTLHSEKNTPHNGLLTIRHHVTGYFPQREIPSSLPSKNLRSLAIYFFLLGKTRDKEWGRGRGGVGTGEKKISRYQPPKTIFFCDYLKSFADNHSSVPSKIFLSLNAFVLHLFTWPRVQFRFV